MTAIMSAPYTEDFYPENSSLTYEVGLDPPYQCKVCDKVFAIPARLQRHYRIHTGEKPFKCDFCNKLFSVKENLNVHRRIHTKERPYECAVCNRAFEHSGKLHRHMRTHTGERPHKCDLCGKTFVQSGQLVIHTRAHTGEKPYTCDYCQKGFTCSKQLKVHIRTHTGEKPYECDVCGKTFGYNHVLKMHKMSHLGEKLYKCTLCEEFFNSRKALDKHIKEHSQDVTKEAANDASPIKTVPLSTINYQEINSYDKGFYPNYMRETQLPALSPICVPLTPPRSPESTGSSVVRTNLGDQDQSYRDNNSSFKELVEPCLPQLAYFTTIKGEKIPCPADLLVRLQDTTYTNNSLKYQQEVKEKQRLQQELQARIMAEEERHQKENIFCGSVLKVLESCIGMERMERLGYPQESIDEVVMKTLRLMGTDPCWEPSLKPMDRIKVNLRLLLECCVPDKCLWNAFGWKGKSIEDIVSEFLQQC